MVKAQNNHSEPPPPLTLDEQNFLEQLADNLIDAAIESLQKEQEEAKLEEQKDEA